MISTTAERIVGRKVTVIVAMASVALAGEAFRRPFSHADVERWGSRVRESAAIAGRHHRFRLAQFVGQRQEDGFHVVRFAVVLGGSLE